MQFRCLLRHLTPVCQNYHIGDGTKALVESTKEGLEKLGKTLGIVPDFERDVFDVPLGCRRFILRPDLGDCEIQRRAIESSCFFILDQMKRNTGALSSKIRMET